MRHPLGVLLALLGLSISSPALSNQGHTAASAISETPHRVPLKPSELDEALRGKTEHDVAEGCRPLSDKDGFIELLKARLVTGSDRSRIRATWCFWVIEDPTPVLEELFVNLSRGRALRGTTAEAFKYAPAALAVPRLSSMVGDESLDARFRQSAGVALAGMSEHDPVMSAFIDMFNASVEGSETRSLALLGTARAIRSAVLVEEIPLELARPAETMLRRALTDRDPDKRLTATQGLIGLLEDSHEIVPVLLDVLTLRDRDLRLEAMEVLNYWGDRDHHLEPADHPELRAAVSTALMGDLRARNLVVRYAALSAVESMGDEAEPALVEIAELLDDRDIEVASLAASTLARLRCRAAPAIPALEHALSRSSAQVRWKAAGALGAMEDGARQSVPALSRALHDPHERVRYEAAKALGAMGPAAAGSIRDLLALLDDDLHADDETPGDIAGRIGGNTMRMRKVPTGMVIECSEDPDATAAAIEALGKMGSAAREAAPVMQALLRSGPVDHRAAAASALLRIGTSVTEPLSVLMEIAKKPNPPDAVRFALLQFPELVQDRPHQEYVRVLQEALRMAEAAGFQRLPSVLKKALTAAAESDLDGSAPSRP